MLIKTSNMYCLEIKEGSWDFSTFTKTEFVFRTSKRKNQYCASFILRLWVPPGLKRNDILRHSSPTTGNRFYLGLNNHKIKYVRNLLTLFYNIFLCVKFYANISSFTILLQLIGGIRGIYAIKQKTVGIFLGFWK